MGITSNSTIFQIISVFEGGKRQEDLSVNQKVLILVELSLDVLSFINTLTLKLSNVGSILTTRISELRWSMAKTKQGLSLRINSWKVPEN